MKLKLLSGYAGELPDDPGVVEVGARPVWFDKHFWAVNAQFFVEDPEALSEQISSDADVLLDHIRNEMRDPDVVPGLCPAISAEKIYGAFPNSGPSRIVAALDELSARMIVEDRLFRCTDPALLTASRDANGLGTSPSPLADCVRLAGDGPAGRLLYQVLYWRTRMRIMRDGLLWIVKTRAQWMAETALSRHQYDRALARLKERHLVETCYRRFKGVKTTHLRPLTYVALTDPEELAWVAGEYLESAEADGGTRTRSGRADV